MPFPAGRRMVPTRHPRAPRQATGNGSSRVPSRLVGLVVVAALAAMLTVTAPGAAAAARLSLSPSSGVAGTAVSVSGAGFAPRSRVQLRWDGDAAAMPVASVRGGGRFTATFRVPAVAAGPHTLSATSSGGTTVLASVRFTVVVPAAMPTPTPVASATPTPTPTASPTPAPTPSPTPTAAPTAAPTATPSPRPSPTATPPSFVVRCAGGLCLDGQPYVFTGLNIYNANSRSNCWYTLGSGSGLGDSLTAIGPGQEAFRAWFFQRQATTNGVRDWAAFDHTLAVAAAHGQRVIATLANQWGDCENASGSPVYKTEAWYSSGYRSTVDPGMTATYRDWVREVVSRYRDNPTILAWQLVNEGEARTTPGGACSATAATTVAAWTRDVAGLVKALDPNHLVSLGTIGNGQCGTSSGTAYQDLHAIPDIDLCEYHDYDSLATWPGDQWNGLAVRLSQCTALGKPMFIGETGIRTTDAGSLAARASAIEAKWTAQIGGGIVGELAWAWAAAGQSTGDGYSINPADPLLAVLSRH